MFAICFAYSGRWGQGCGGSGRPPHQNDKYCIRIARSVITPLLKHVKYRQQNTIDLLKNHPKKLSASTLSCPDRPPPPAVPIFIGSELPPPRHKVFNSTVLRNAGAKLDTLAGLIIRFPVSGNRKIEFQTVFSILVFRRIFSNTLLATRERTSFCFGKSLSSFCPHSCSNTCSEIASQISCSASSAHNITICPCNLEFRILFQHVCQKMC